MTISSIPDIPVFHTDFSTTPESEWPFAALPVGAYADFTHPAAAAAYARYVALGGHFGFCMNYLPPSGAIMTRIAKYGSTSRRKPHFSLDPLHPIYSMPIGSVRTFTPPQMREIEKVITWYGHRFGGGAFRRSGLSVARLLPVGASNTYGIDFLNPLPT